MKNKERRKQTKEKALLVYGKPFGGRCTKCGKYGNKSTDPECPEKEKKMKKKKEKNIQRNHLIESATIASDKGKEFLIAKKERK